MDAADENRVSGIVWKRLSASDDAPSCLVLDGRNPFIKNEEEKFGPHGYLDSQIQWSGANRTRAPSGWHGNISKQDFVNGRAYAW